MGHCQEVSVLIVVILGLDGPLSCFPQVFEELGSYMASLEKLLALGADTLYPGHGPKVENGQEAIQQYIAHRMAREKQVS